jgi:hypothetical protein
MTDTITHEFTTQSKRKNGYVHHRAFHVVIKSDVELSESVKAARWYPELAPAIVRVEQWTIQSDLHMPGTQHDWAEKAKLVWPTTQYVVHTQFGSAVITEIPADHWNPAGAAISGIIFKAQGQRKGKALTLATWRKYGRKRGHGMAYLHAAYGLGYCTSPDLGSDICEQEAVERLIRGHYGAVPLLEVEGYYLTLCLPY